MTGVLQTPTGRVFHAKERQPIFTLTDLVDRQNVRMIEARCRFRFASKSLERFTRIGMVGPNSFKRHDPAGMSLPRAVNDAHPAAPDLFQYLVIAHAPLDV